MNRVNNKTQVDIAGEWDQIAELRSRQIREGRDISYSNVLVPTLMELIESRNSTRTLDVGCGCGHLTELLAKVSSRVVGLDISRTSIALAKVYCSDLKNVELVHSSIEDYAEPATREPFTLAVANMSLMTVLDLRSVLMSIAKLLVPSGHLVFTITHPCFWPLYWNYPEEWYRYSEEIIIEAPFTISLDRSETCVTTHVHRPLQSYFARLNDAGFVTEYVKEPMPAPDIETLYPKRWEYPRFFAAACRKCG